MKSPKDDNIINNGRDWEGLPQIGTNCTGKAWWLGGIVPVYTIPTLSSLSDIASNGIILTDKEWTYNKPYGGEHAPFRISDFIGYSHNANYPPLNITMDESITLNSNFRAEIQGSYDADGNFTASELKDILYCDNLYGGITIINKTRGTSATSIHPTPISYDDGAYWYLNPNSGLSINNGGFGQVVSMNDNIEVYLFLANGKDADWSGIGMKYSAFQDENSQIYRNFIVGYINTYVKVPFKINNFSAITSGFKDRYYRHDDNIYKINKFITNLSGIFIASV